MGVLDIIEKKRDGVEHTEDEIYELIRHVASGDIPITKSRPG